MRAGCQNPARAPVRRQSRRDASNPLSCNILTVSLSGARFYGDKPDAPYRKSFKFNILSITDHEKSVAASRVRLVKLSANSLFRNILPANDLVSIFCPDQKRAPSNKSFINNILQRCLEKICWSSQGAYGTVALPHCVLPAIGVVH